MSKTITVTNQQALSAFNGYNFISRKDVGGALVFPLAKLGAQLRAHARVLEQERELLNQNDYTDEFKEKTFKELLDTGMVSFDVNPLPSALLQKYDFPANAIEVLLPFITE
jgi:hypothetical protein